MTPASEEIPPALGSSDTSAKGVARHDVSDACEPRQSDEDGNRPWSLGERIDVAERMARAGSTIAAIMAVTQLTEETAHCIKQRVSPDHSDYSRLKRGLLEG